MPAQRARQSAAPRRFEVAARAGAHGRREERTRSRARAMRCPYVGVPAVRRRRSPRPGRGHGQSLHEGTPVARRAAQRTARQTRDVARTSACRSEPKRTTAAAASTAGRVRVACATAPRAPPVAITAPVVVPPKRRLSMAALRAVGALERAVRLQAATGESAQSRREVAAYRAAKARRAPPGLRACVSPSCPLPSIPDLHARARVCAVAPRRTCASSRGARNVPPADVSAMTACSASPNAFCNAARMSSSS